MAAWTAQDELHIPEQPPFPRFAAFQQTRHFPTSDTIFQVSFPGLLQGSSACTERLQQPCRAGDGISTGVPSEPSSLHGSSGSSFGNRLENRLDNSGKHSSDSGNKSSPSDGGSCDSIEEGSRSPTVFLARVSNLPAHTGESDILGALQASNFASSVDLCSILQEPQDGTRQALLRFTERTAAMAFRVAWEGSYRFGVVPPWPPIRVEVQGVVSSHSFTANGVSRRRERRSRENIKKQVEAQHGRFHQSSSSSSGSTYIHQLPHQQSSSSASELMGHFPPQHQQMVPAVVATAAEAAQVNRLGAPAEMGAATEEEEDDDEQSVSAGPDTGQRHKGAGAVRAKGRGGQGAKHTMPPGEIRAKGITALMVRNIPYDLLQSDMLKQLDNSGFADTYDFCYLPCAFATRDNHGYAFINFITADAAAALVEKWDRRPLFDSVKPLFISPASQQGLDALLKLCEKKKLYRIRNPRYQPFVRKSSGQMTSKGSTVSKDQDVG